jgi:hypothetical protein
MLGKGFFFLTFGCLHILQATILFANRGEREESRSLESPCPCLSIHVRSNKVIGRDRYL